MITQQTKSCLKIPNQNVQPIATSTISSESTLTKVVRSHSHADISLMALNLLLSAWSMGHWFSHVY